RAVSIVIYFLGIDQHESKDRPHIDAQKQKILLKLQNQLASQEDIYIQKIGMSYKNTRISQSTKRLRQ
ncbi:MAG: hypothetical protein WA364_08150, partial [Candidatus Nitrosopolaris sp.]